MMKKIIYILALASGLGTMSCEDFLNIDSKTSITGDYIASEEGIDRAVVGLYDRDRRIVIDKGSSNLYVVTMMDYQTDISVFRGGTSAGMFRMDNLQPTTGDFESYWTHHYNVIGKANEIISNAEKIGLDNPKVKQAWGEAKFFRGRAYFELWKRYGRLYMNLEPLTQDNLQREFKPSEGEEVLSVIRQDLDDACEALDWEIPEGVSSAQYGRVTKGTAMHVRAQVAMWDKDWPTVIELGEEIFKHHNMENKLEDVFMTSENLRSSEVLWAYQYSPNPGGGGSLANGHHLSCNTTAQYRSVPGCISAAADGGYGWGRIYPNTYLFSLYDKEKDTRYTNMFKHEYYYNNPSSANYGKKIDPERYKGKAQYLNYIHPMSLKFFDCWTNKEEPERISSYKDVIVYRLGETALMLCEAYFNTEGPSGPNALKYYNKTWERAGNDHENGPLTMEKIIDEYARECHFEGVRWPLLKRLGILAERVKAHAGDSRKDDPYLDRDYTEPRKNFIEGKHEIWPIPQNQIDLMGGPQVFPQNEGWN